MLMHYLCHPEPTAANFDTLKKNCVVGAISVKMNVYPIMLECLLNITL